jgi:hypothetical protein
VGLKDLAKRWTASTKELHAERLQDRFQGLDATPIKACPTRLPVRISGEIAQVRVRPRSGFPALEVIVTDGSGEATAVFTGRRALGGVHTGRGVVLEGVAHDERGRRVLLNPAYTLLPE